MSFIQRYNSIFYPLIKSLSRAFFYFYKVFAFSVFFAHLCKILSDKDASLQSHPGGCELGARPIDQHIKGLKELGAKITEEYGFILCSADKLVGTRISLNCPSVGATENIMLAAVHAEGTTVISNAAMEPEIVDLQNFLNLAGAKIRGAGTSEVVIDGVSKLCSTEFTVMPDRIVAGTYLAAAAITGGQIVLNNIVREHMYPITGRLQEAGCEIAWGKNSVKLLAPKRIKPIETLMTNPHPGFPTDMQPQFMAMLSIASGTSIISETMFESRNKHISELVRMGANIYITQDGKNFVVMGVNQLSGTTVTSRDLRGGAALILAGLAAEGETTVTESKYVERGYEKIDQSLNSLNADVKYIEY